MSPFALTACRKSPNVACVLLSAGQCYPKNLPRRFFWWTGDFADIPHDLRSTGNYRRRGNELIVSTKNGPVPAHIGDCVLVDLGGSPYPCVRAVALATYDFPEEVDQ